ncbi:MAG: exodeoxyribonuclease VII small subunit [Chlamydiia bacterium]|nr:exodeoxyribonuclease VII small subunit [Chlamydiia bacterium]
MTQEEKPLSFEKAFERLEKILEAMNSAKTPLEESLRLYEEAEKLMRYCSQYLSHAEQKIEKLIKGRSGELAVDGENRPRTEPLVYG